MKYPTILCLLILGSLQLQAAAPRNDAQSEAFGVFDDCYIVGDNSEATHEAGELDHASAGGSKSLWWSWSPSASDEATLTLRPYGGTGVFVLSVYQDDKGTLTQIAQINPQTNPGQHFTAQFEVEAGEEYVIAVDSPSGSSGGRFYFGLNQVPEFLTPLQVRVPVGETLEIPINVMGNPTEVMLEHAPESVSYDSETQMLRGTFTSDDSEIVTLFAENDFGYSEVELVLVPEAEEYIFTGAASAVGFVGVPFEYVLSFDGDPPLTSQDIQASQLPQGFYLAKDSGQWKIKGLSSQSYDTAMQIHIQMSEGHDLHLEIPLVIAELGYARLQPAIISPLMTRGVVGQPFSYQIEMSLPSEAWFSVSSLPDGLALNEETGVISGTLEHHADVMFLIRAHFNYPPYHTEAELQLQILEEYAFAPEIQSAPTAVAWVGLPFEYQIEATNGTEQYWMQSGLPDGLTLNENTGLIYGVPEQSDLGDSLAIVAGNRYGSTEFVVTLDILEPYHIAHITSPAQVSTTVGEFFEYQVETNLEMFEPNQMSVQLPEGFEYDEANSRIFGVPQSVGDETAEIQFLNNEIAVQIRVLEDETPVEFLNAATAVGRVGSFFYFPMNAPRAVDFTSSSTVSGVSFDQSAGVFSGVPTIAGTYEVNVTGNSSNGERSYTKLKIVILESDETVPPPIILSPGQLLAEVGETFAYSIASSEYGNGDFDVEYLSDGVFFDAASGTLYGAVDSPDELEVEISAGDATADLHMHFYEPAEPPLLVTSAPSALGRAGEWFEYQIETNDIAAIEAGSVYFQEGVSFPDFLNLDEDTGLISGYLAEDEGLPIDFEVHVDAPEASTQLSFTIVDGGTDVPVQVVSPAHIVAYPNEAFEYQFVFDQSDVTLDISYLEEGLFYNAATRTLSGSMAYESQNWIEFERQDGSGGDWFHGELRLELRDTEDRPAPLMISDAGPVANRGELFSYAVSFDRGGIAWSVDHAPEWLSKSGNQLVGVVPEGESSDQARVYLSFYDESGETYSAELTINYNSPEPPAVVVSPASAHATVGHEFSYQIEIEGDYDEIQVNLPEWALYDPASMRVTGVPDSSVTEQLYIQVSTSGPSILARVDVFVEDAWQPAVITSLQPSPSFEGIPYEYQIEVDGVFDSLDFNGSEWLTLDSETLLLSGIPNDPSGGYFDVYMHNQFGDSQVFVEVEGEERVAPYILEELQDLVIYPGGKAYFIPKVTLSQQYEWFKDAVSLGWFGDWLELEGVTPANQGEYSVRLTNDYAEAWTLPVTLQVGQAAAYRDWLINSFGSEIDDPHHAESGLSFAGDSTPDLMKWAFGVDPTSVVTEPLSESSLGEGGFQIQFDRSTAPRDVRIIVERSMTLGADDWTAIAVLPPEGSWQAQQPDVTVDEVGTGELRTVSVVDSGEYAQSFMRVRIELVPAAE